MNKPLVSFCVKFYNQIQYVESALKGAFAQTYRPLEIVISDDGSTDGSHELIQKLIAEYRNSGGDIPVVYNHNEKNLGNLGNWDKLCSLAKGELLVKADGDDISLPNRTEEIVRHWVDDGCEAVLISHGGVRIDPKGKEIGRTWKPNARMPLGAVMAWSRKCYSEFIPSDNRNVLDDTVYGWRAAFIGRELYFDTPLVYYRVGSGVSSILNKPRKPTLRGWSAIVEGLNVALKDLDYIYKQGKMSDSRYESFKSEVVRQRDKSALYVQLISGSTIRERMLAFHNLSKFSNGLLARTLQLVYVLPSWLGDPLLNSYATTRCWLRRLRSR